MAVPWDEMRRRLLDRVFYNFDEDEIIASQDLRADGYLDSLSVLVTLGIFDEELGEGDEGMAVKHARVTDTTNMAALEALYLRLSSVSAQ